MPLYELADDRMRLISRTTFAGAKIRERQDLQRILREQIEILVPHGMVIAEEFSSWDDSRRSIDLLVLDRDRTVVVVELKRTEDGGHMELQAIRYAAMISAMTFAQAVEAHLHFLPKIGVEADPYNRILEFLRWDEPDEEAFGQDVRILLASADFSKELTTAVLWLNEQGLDIRCVRLVPYTYGGKTLLDVQQVIPLPEAEEYQIRVREKASRERASRHEQSSRADRNQRFWSELLRKANSVTPLHQNVSPSKENWITAANHGVGFNYVTARNTGRAELYLSRPDKAENKVIFDELYAKKEVIERAFDGRLSWQRLDNRVASRVAAEVPGGPVSDESTWDSFQDALIDVMRRLERALAEEVAGYRGGEKPDTRRADNLIPATDTA